jgi:hypothetical protein
VEARGAVGAAKKSPYLEADSEQPSVVAVEVPTVERNLDWPLSLEVVEARQVEGMMELQFAEGA